MRSRPVLEALEARRLPSFYTVSKANSSGTDSLPDAVAQADADTRRDGG
jgi:hypothetical protein